MERKLTAILAADVVGYSRLMERDEAGTFAALKSHRQDLIDPKIAEHHGRLVKLMGDGALVEFASVVEAVACAVAIQDGMAARNEDVAEDRRVTFRIGVHLGDVMVEDDDLYGDGVNVAARLEGLAEPGGVCISQQALDQVETKLDLAYEDLGEQQVKNISRPVRAYRVRPEGAAPPAPETAKRRGWNATRIFGSAAVVALVVVGIALGWWQPWKPDVEPASIERMAFPLPEKPSIAVLPFDNLSSDPGQDYFADGMTDDLITDLSKISGLFVIARNSTFAYKGKPVKVQQVAEDLGVRYVLEGSVRRVGNNVRINAQLVDATTGVHLWADRYDGTLEDVFALQDEVTEQIVYALAVKLTTDEEERLAQALKVDPDAYDILLRGLELYRRYSKETNAEARAYFERAVAIDPDFARAHADIALTHAEDAFHGWAESPERSSQLALEMAQHALTLDNNSRVGRFALAYTYLNMKRYDEALAENRRELDLDPNHAEGHAQRGLILSYVGRPAEGLEAIRTAMRLDPRHPFFYVWILGQANFLLRQTEEAIGQFEKSIESNPDFVIGHIMLASAYAHVGRIEDAEWEAEEILVLLPDFTLAAEREKAAYKNPAHLEYYLDGLRKAGIPEQPPLALPDKPSIAVLPFTNMSGDPAQEYFADGMTEDLITDLAKISGLLVIARNSTFAYKGQSPDVREVARKLGVRYVVEGSVRKAGGRIRINAQLIDAETGAHLWAERYDREAIGVFDLQDEVRARIVTALRVKLTPAEVTRLARHLTNNAEAYDYYMRGLQQESFFTKEGNLESRRLLERAIELDPAFAAAYGRLATAHTLAAETGWSPAPDDSMETARLLAEEAVALDDDLPQAHWAVARVFSRKRLFDGDRAIASLRKAIALDPNYADGHAFLATVLFFVGRAEEALGHIETAMRLNPHFPFWYYYALGASQFMLTRYDAAIESLEKAIERNPAWTSTHRILVAAYGHLGMIDEAEWEMEELRMLGFEPTLANWRSRIQIQDPAYLARYFDGLRKAGVPE
jgi:TolB-like protein/class 3 adenylate cyclase/predicted Zn-dependent protease